MARQNSDAQEDDSVRVVTDRDGHPEAGDPPAKRRRADQLRTRVSRACDRCKSRKTRCSGKWPCSHCSQVGLHCSFTASYRRGRLPSIELATGNDLSTTGPTSSSSMGDVDVQEHLPEHVSVQGPRVGLPSPASVEHPFIPNPQLGQPEPQGSLLQSIPPTHNEPTEDHSAQSSRNSPEPAQVDQQGHYVGPASGASFLLRIQRKLQQQPSFTSETSIFTFGDLPLPTPDTSVLILPPREEANELLAHYFDFASVTHRFLHRPTVQGWLDELCETNGAMRDKADARSRKALLFMVLAYAKNYQQGGNGSVDSEASAVFFSAAEDQLAGEKGAIRLTSVQARLAQCFYLLSQSRLNHTWTLFGTTAHLALALGIHRRRLGDSHVTVDYVDLECRKRTFWCMYNLDTYLSAALGRPRSFHDDDIDQELPASLNDSQIQRRHIDISGVSSQSIMSGAIAHFRISRTVAKVLKDFYSIRSQSTEKQLTMASSYSRELDEWWKSMKYLLDTANYDSGLFLPIFFRQRNVLSLAFWHAQILLYRPFLLNSFTSLTNLSLRRSTRSMHAANVAQNVQLCLDAAMNIVNLVDEINTQGQLYNAFWFTRYFAFCAVVVIYVHAIQCHSDEHFATLQAASRCQAQVSTRAVPGSLSERYGVVLQELRLEMLRHKPSLRAAFPEDQIQQPGGRSDQGYNPFPNTQTGQETGNGLNATNGDEAIDSSLVFQDGQAPQMVEPSPSSSVAQMSGWGQFDSLVTSGIAGFGWEGVLTDNPVEAWGLSNANL